MENEFVLKYNSKLFTEVYLCDSSSDETICEKAKECLRLGADVNAVDKNNAENTALHVAVRKRFKNLVRFLLDNGAKADIRNERGLTAFELAKQSKCDDIIVLFENYSQHSEFLSCDEISFTSHVELKSCAKSDSSWVENLRSRLNSVPKQPCIDIDDRDSGWPIVLEERFYRTIEMFEYLILIDILVGDKTIINDEVVLGHLRTVRNPIIIQCRSLGSAKVYFKESQRDPEVIDLSSEPMEVDQDFLTRLNDKESFGIGLILEGFTQKIIGAFSDDQKRSLFNMYLIDKSFPLIHYAVRHDHLLAVRWLRLDIYKMQWNLFNDSISREMLAALLKIEFPIPAGKIQLSTDVVNQFQLFKEELYKNAGYRKRQDILGLLLQCTTESDYQLLIRSFLDGRRYIIALEIIKADGLYPYNFDISNIEVSIPGGQDFLDFSSQRNQLHDLIVHSTLEHVKDHLGKLCKSKSYINVGNVSAVATALRNKKFDIYAFLWSQSVCFKDDRENHLIHQLGDDKLRLREQMTQFVPRFIESTIDYLMSKTQLVRFQRDSVNRQQIRGYYERLNEIPEISIIFGVVQYSDYLDIILDFGSEITIEIDPMSVNMEGYYYPALGRICIGAKVNEERLLGVIAHELTHLAMQLVYSNQCKPYYRADIVEEWTFKELVAETSQLPFVDRIISIVFNTDSYQTDVRAAELIVRVNHMLAMHGLEKGKALLKNQVPVLCDYYNSKVMQRCQAFVIDRHLIKWRDCIKQLNFDHGIMKHVNESIIKFKSRISLKEFLESAVKRIQLFVTANTWWIATQIYENFKDLNLSDGEFTLLNVQQLPNFNCGSINKPHVFVVTISSISEVHQVSDEVVDWVIRIFENTFCKFVLVLNEKHVSIIKAQLQCHVPEEAVEQKTDGHLELEKFLDSEKQLFILTTKNPRLSMISICQILSTWFYSCQNGIVVLNFDNFLKIYNQNKQELISDACKIIVLESTSLSKVMTSEVRHWYSNTVVPSGKKFIVVTPQWMKCLVNPGIQHSKHDHSVSLSDLAADSSALLLDQDVCFQGNIVKLKELIKTSSYDVVDAETINKLENREAITVGKELSGDETFYVPRTLKYGARIKGECIKKNLPNEESVANDVAVHFRDKCVEVISLKDQKHFQELCEQQPAIDIHLLKRNGDDFIWKKSKSTPTGFVEFQKFVNKELTEDLSEASFVDELDEHQLVIVSDKAGMGKTTLLTHIARLLKDKHPHMWIIQLNLNLYAKVLDEEAKKSSFKGDEIDKAVNFFVDKLLESRSETKLETKFEKVLIEEFIKNSGDIALLFDAFDELRVKQQNVILKLIKSLQKTKVKQMWVTTRPYRQARIEKELLNFSHKLIPFTDKNQLDFLTAFWKQKLSDETKVQKFADIILNRFNNCISDEEKKFTGIPLQTKMLAEAFETDCKAFHNSTDEEPSFTVEFDLMGLYEHFISAKFDICQFLKRGLEQLTPQDDSTKKNLYPVLRDQHRLLALRTLFDGNELEMILDNDKISADIEDLFPYGIINKVADGQPQFIHRTFAEYFTAQFIVDRITKHVSGEGFIEFVLGKILVEESWKVVRTFISMQLSKTDDNSANWSQQIKALAINSELNPWDSLCVAAREANLKIFIFVLTSLKNADCWDFECSKAANVFFTAITLSRLEEAKLLLDSGFNVNLVSIGDCGYSRTPLCEAVKSGKVEICKWLLNNKAECSIRLGQMHNYCPLGSELYYKWDGCTALHVACMHRRDKVMSLLLEKNSACVNSTDNYQMTPLHVAAIFGYVDIVAMLINHKANINAVNVGGYTPLCEAIRWQRKEVVEYLVNFGVDVNSTNGSGVTPLHVASVYGNEEIVQMLIKHNADVNALVDLDEVPTADVSSWHMTELIKKACNCTAVTPLYLARVNGNEDIAAILVDKGADDVHTVPITDLHNIFSDRSVILVLKVKGFTSMAVTVAAAVSVAVFNN